MTNPKPMLDTVSPTRAYLDYLALGDARSIAALHLHYLEAQKRGEIVGHLPAATTLAKWGWAGNWADKAAKHDAEIIKTAQRKMVTSEAGSRVAMAKRFRKVAMRALRKTLAGLEAKACNATKPADLVTLLSLAETAANRAEVLAGGVTDRRETVETKVTEDKRKLVDPMAMIEKFLAPDERDHLDLTKH